MELGRIGGLAGGILTRFPFPFVHILDAEVRRGHRRAIAHRHVRLVLEGLGHLRVNGQARRGERLLDDLRDHRHVGAAAHQKHAVDLVQGHAMLLLRAGQGLHAACAGRHKRQFFFGELLDFLVNRNSFRIIIGSTGLMQQFIIFLGGQLVVIMGVHISLGTGCRRFQRLPQHIISITRQTGTAVQHGFEFRRILRCSHGFIGGGIEGSDVDGNTNLAQLVLMISAVL